MLNTMPAVGAGRGRPACPRSGSCLLRGEKAAIRIEGARLAAAGRPKQRDELADAHLGETSSSARHRRRSAGDTCGFDGLSMTICAPRSFMAYDTRLGANIRVINDGRKPQVAPQTLA